MKKIPRLVGLSNQDSAVFLYRIIQPLRFAADQGLIEAHHMPFFGQHANHLTSKEFIEYFVKEGSWGDIIFSTCGTDREYLSLLMGLREAGKMKLVIDLDDDILSTHLEPNNPASKAYTNKEARFAEYTQACIREADMVTVSTEYLAKKYASLNKNIVVVKNCIDPNFFRYKNKKRKFTLGYAGSGSHQADLDMLQVPILLAKDRYNSYFKVLGPMYTKIADSQVSWTDMLKYPKVLADQGFSVGLAPLKDSIMTRAKSNLRWLEYSSLKIPTIASDVVPFRGIENIRLATEIEEWFSHIEELIKNPSLVTKEGEMAYNELQEKYNPEYWGRVFAHAISSL